MYVYSHIAASGWIITQHTQHYTLHNTVHIIHYKELLNTATPPSHTPHVIPTTKMTQGIRDERVAVSNSSSSKLFEGSGVAQSACHCRVAYCWLCACIPENNDVAVTS